MRVAVLLPVLLALAACGGGSRVVAPEPATDFSHDVDSLPSLPPGTIVAPLTLDLQSALTALEEQVPRRFGDITKRIPVPGSKRKSFAFEVHRNPFKVSFAGDTILLSAVIQYKGRGWYDPPIGPDINGECGTSDEPPRARLAVRVVPRLGEDWHLLVRTQLTQVAPLTKTDRDQCKVSFLNFDVTGKVISAAEGALRKVLPGIDRKLARVDVKSPLERIWGDLQKPIRVTDSLWLVLLPQAVNLGSVSGSRQLVGAEVALTAAPRLVTGPRPDIVPTPLPPLGPMEAEEGFSIPIEGFFDYAVMSAALTQQLAGKTVKAAGGQLEVKRVTVRGIGAGRLALGLDFTGTASGKVWFIGTPQFDLSTGLLSVPDLDFDATSAGMLVQGVAWLKGDAIREFLRDQAKVPAGEVLKRIETMAVKEMNRTLARGVELRATIEKSETAGILVRPTGLVIRARATGSAHLDLGPELLARKAPSP